MTSDSPRIRAEIQAEREKTRAAFHQVLDALSGGAFQKQSLNSGWTNGEILAHMRFGFIAIGVLLPMARVWDRLPKFSSTRFAWLPNLFTGPFKWFNELGARAQGKFFTQKRIGNIYDRVYFSLVGKLNSIRDEEWERGMYYPQMGFLFQ